MNVSLLGAKGLAEKLSKKGTASDITLYNTKNNNVIFSFVEPSGFPEKISPLPIAVGMCDFAVVNVTPESMNASLGEILLVLDAMKKPGFFVLEGIVREQLEPLVKGLYCEKYDYVENDVPKIWEKFHSMKEERKEGPAKVIIDHSFLVKSVGTVVLGIVERGSVKKYDTLELYPQHKEVVIKSIQMQDEEAAECRSGDRVGFSIKGADHEEATRGAVLAFKGSLKSSTEFKVVFEKSRFFKEEVPKRLMLSIGLQYMQCDFDGNVIKADKGVVYEAGEPFVLSDPSKKNRIVGKGSVLV